MAHALEPTRRSPATLSKAPQEDLLLARVFLETIPRSMRAIRAEMRSHRELGLTIPQFRVLAQLSQESLTNCELAERIGIAVPSMSRMIDGLVRKGYVTRQPAKTGDRRQVPLLLSSEGERVFKETFKGAQKRFAALFGSIPATERRKLSEALEILQELFT